MKFFGEFVEKLCGFKLFYVVVGNYDDFDVVLFFYLFYMVLFCNIVCWDIYCGVVYGVIYEFICEELEIWMVSDDGLFIFVSYVLV